MRNEKQMLALFQHFFNENDDLRVFCMNGSRVNQNIPDDKFKDYAVVFFTNSLAKYTEDSSFINYFGELLLMTEPDELSLRTRNC